MAILNCKRLRTVVKLAGVFLIVGMFLEVSVHFLAPTVDLMCMQPAAMGMVFASPVIVLVAVAISLIPGLSLRDCTQLLD